MIVCGMMGWLDVKVVRRDGWFSALFLIGIFLVIMPTSLMSAAATSIQPAYLETWSASVTVSPSEIRIVQGQQATFTITVSLVSYAHVNIKTIVVWLKLVQISGGSQFSIVSKDFGSGPMSGTPPYQATLTLRSSSATPVGLLLFHILAADSLQDLSTCPTQVGNAMYCGDSGTFGVYVNAPFSTWSRRLLVRWMALQPYRRVQ